MTKEIDYSKYKCPWAHIKHKNGHGLELIGAIGDTRLIRCKCGFDGPFNITDPEILGLELLSEPEPKSIGPKDWRGVSRWIIGVEGNLVNADDHVLDYLFNFYTKEQANRAFTDPMGFRDYCLLLDIKANHPEKAVRDYQWTDGQNNWSVNYDGKYSTGYNTTCRYGLNVYVPCHESAIWLRDELLKYKGIEQ
ncbi:MAG: hypothetical protein ACR2PH_05530 [Desulfobulbia bacterium]